MDSSIAKVKSKIRKVFPGMDWKNPKRHLSVLVKGGKIYAYGESSLSGKPYFATNRGRSCHAEMSALKSIYMDRRKVGKLTLWNFRWSRKGKLVNSRPCIHCQRVLLRAGIRKVVYSTDDGQFIKCRLADVECKPSSGDRY